MGKGDRKGKQVKKMCVIKQVPTVAHWSVAPRGHPERHFKERAFHSKAVSPTEQGGWGIYALIPQ